MSWLRFTIQSASITAILFAAYMMRYRVCVYLKLELAQEQPLNLSYIRCSVKPIFYDTPNTPLQVFPKCTRTFYRFLEYGLQGI